MSIIVIRQKCEQESGMPSATLRCKPTTRENRHFLLNRQARDTPLYALSNSADNIVIGLAQAMKPVTAVSLYTTPTITIKLCSRHGTQPGSKQVASCGHTQATDPHR